MSNVFHLAIEGGVLATTVPFYTNILGLQLGADAEEGRYQDIDFWGNELTLHESTPRTCLDCEYHAVEMAEVPCPHFGVHLPLREWMHLKELFLTVHPDNVLLGPIERYLGQPTEQRTIFVRDPNYNVIEIKTLRANQ